MAPQTNGTGKWTFSIVISIVSLVVGLVIGGLNTRVQAEERFVSKDVYLRDQEVVSHKLDRIEAKLDSLVRAVERNTAILDNRRK